MIGIENREVERKVLAMLTIVGQSPEPVGARIISRRLQDHGIDLTERAVRYHLKLMDERGLTHLVGRDGRLITDQGKEELKTARVQDKVGLAISRIETLAFRTSFNRKTHTGSIPVNVSLFRKEIFSKALAVMAPVFRSDLCASDLIAVAEEGDTLGAMTVPEGKVGLATVCSVVINGVLLKAGVPMDSRFGGILQIRNRQPLRFVELIHYAGSSLDPSEVFIRGKMTSVIQAANQGCGKVLANFREIPAICLPVVEKVVRELKEAGLGGPLLVGNASDPVCEIAVEPNKIGMILIGGMNPVAAAEEAGFEAENKPMSTIVDYEHLIRFDEVLSHFQL